MSWPFTPYALVYFLTAAVSAAVAVYAWRRRPVVGAARLAWLMAAGAQWAFALGLELVATDLPAKLFWSKVAYVGTVSAPVLFLLFALQYSGSAWLPALRYRLLLWVIPAATLLLVATNEWHHLLWTSFTPSPAGHNILIYGHGPWFYVAVAYYYFVSAIGAAAIIRSAVRFAHVYRSQSLVLLIGASVPIATGALYVLGLSPAPGLDISPIGFMFAGLALVWGILRFRLLDLAPVARDLLFESMSDGVVVLDAQNRIVDINRAAQQLLGATVAVVGQSARVVLAARPDLIERFRDVMTGQVEIVLGTEAPRHLDLRISPLRDRRGRFTGRLIVLRDITERKLAEEELHRSNVELQARNAELDAYAHTVAHDLKNPLGLLAGYAGLLMENGASLSPDELREYARVISEHTSKMLGIINGLLLLASARQVQVEVVPLDMAVIVAEAQRRLAREIQELHAEIILPESWPTVWGYQPWVEEVWVNYLSNALKYGGRPEATPPVPPRIELGATWAPPGVSYASGGHVRFWVRDNGPGIAVEDQARLFVPFSRPGQSEVTGHGLGLSIVQRIVERLGGQVGVESGLGSGSTFYFTLPRS
jgi:PAS domain S-box-containing protein